jgi:uncharacterized protein YjbI with pentapeptide repeats
MIDSIHDFIGERFNAPAYFNDVEFRGHGWFYFSAAYFNMAAHFANATFSDIADFLETNFHSTVSFNSSTFDTTAGFSYADFHNTADFSGVTFSGQADFTAARFYGLADFSRGRFIKTASFFKTKFDGKVIFSEASFDSTADFANAILGNYGDFSRLKLSETTNLNFSRTVLPDTLDFSFNQKIPNEIDLTAADFSKTNRTVIMLYRADISKVHFEYNHFRLMLPDSVPDERSVPLTYIKLSNDEKASLYEASLKNFQDRGQIESYKLLDIDYKRFKWNSSWASFLPCIPYYWNRFDYDKQYIFIWTFIFLLLFTSINYFILGRLNRAVYPLKSIPALYEMKSVSQRIWYSLVFTSTIFFRLTIKLDNLNFKNVIGSLYVIIIYTVGIICLAYMASFVLNK